MEVVLSMARLSMVRGLSFARTLARMLASRDRVAGRCSGRDVSEQHTGTVTDGCMLNANEGVDLLPWRVVLVCSVVNVWLRRLGC